MRIGDFLKVGSRSLLFQGDDVCDDDLHKLVDGAAADALDGSADDEPGQVLCCAAEGGCDLVFKIRECSLSSTMARLDGIYQKQGNRGVEDCLTSYTDKFSNENGGFSAHTMYTHLTYLTVYPTEATAPLNPAGTH